MVAQIGRDGWAAHNIWEHSTSVRELYTQRARDQADEMDCAVQAAELIKDISKPGESLLDAGCGTGYFFHSLRKRGIALEYYGIDATTEFIAIGKRELSKFKLPQDRLAALRIEDFAGKIDHILCMNVLSNIDNYHRPLERLLQAATKSVTLRESIKEGASYRYVRDKFLDPGVALNVHVNAYDRADIFSFIESYGFKVREVTDRRTGGKPEDVIGYPHYWTFVVATRQ